MKRKLKIVTPLFLLILLTACGGADDESANSSPVTQDINADSGTVTLELNPEDMNDESTVVLDEIITETAEVAGGSAESGALVVEPAQVITVFDEAVVQSEVVSAESETVIAQADRVIVESEAVVVESETVVVEPEAVVVESEMVVVEPEVLNTQDVFADPDADFKTFQDVNFIASNDSDLNVTLYIYDDQQETIARRYIAANSSTEIDIQVPTKQQTLTMHWHYREFVKQEEVALEGISVFSFSGFDE